MGQPPLLTTTNVGKFASKVCKTTKTVHGLGYTLPVKHPMGQPPLLTTTNVGRLASKVCKTTKRVHGLGFR